MKEKSLSLPHEPTDKELVYLMKDVLVDVKERARIASVNFKKLQKNEIEAAKKRFKTIF
jgi:hypothetical protein